MSIYNFVRRTLNLGVGTRDLGYVRSAPPPLETVYGPGQVVRGQLHSSAPAFMKLNQQLVPLSMLGDSGMYVAAQTTLTQLVELQRQQGG